MLYSRAPCVFVSMANDQKPPNWPAGLDKRGLRAMTVPQLDDLLADYNYNYNLAAPAGDNVEGSQAVPPGRAHWL